MAADGPVGIAGRRRPRVLSRLVLLAAAAALAAPAPKPTPTPPARRVVLLAMPGFPSSELERLAAFSKRRGVEVEIRTGAEEPPTGGTVVRLAAPPFGEETFRLAAGFPVTLEEKGFLFDGRAYRAPDDAILLTDPSAPLLAVAIGNTARAAVGVAADRILSRAAPGSGPDYAVASGELDKTGRFVHADGRLEIDRASDRDGVAAREAFIASLVREKLGGVAWEFPESERAFATKWQKAAAAWIKKGKLTVRIYPDAVTKALYTGSSRPADLRNVEGAARVELDASAPTKPDLVSPALAAGGLAAVNPALLARPMLLAAAGVRRVGRFWGRDVRTFAAFERAAGVEPTVEDVLASSDEISPILGVGAAGSWLDAGARLESEAAVDRALGQPDTALAAKLARWRDAALRQTLAPPGRRPLPETFLRGVSYAMTNSIEEGYVSPRSRETLGRLAASGFDSISIMPYGFAAGPRETRVAFVHRSPRGETDEGTVRAVANAHGLGMTAMLKPQLWLPGGAFVGDLAMPDDAAWRRWFAAYRRFVVHHAVVAEAAGADLFCVGAELTATELRKNDWNEVIAAVRLATGAPLTYAANWGARAPEIPFWSSLDVVGVDFYDPLGKAEKLTDAQLTEGARRVVRPLAELAQQLGRPVIFTEAGYPPVRGAWIAPHDEDTRRPRSPEDAARSIAALYRALGGETWWKGIYWWKVFSDGKPAPPDERGFHFLGTPSEKAILDGFRAMSQGAGAR